MTTAVAMRMGEMAALDQLDATVLQNQWIPHVPTPRQAVFLSDPRREVSFGGAAGGGKSDALLMAALQNADVPGYSALILRRTYPELSMPGGLMDAAAEWLGGTAAAWDAESKTWHFPSGASLSFGYLANSRDKYRYRGASFQFVAFDELTSFTQLILFLEPLLAAGHEAREARPTEL